MLVWSIAIGFLVWGDVPTVSLLIGSAIVVLTGLFLFLREARLQRRPPSPPLTGSASRSDR